jgi:hypothetical protein
MDCLLSWHANEGQLCYHSLGSWAQGSYVSSKRVCFAGATITDNVYPLSEDSNEASQSERLRSILCLAFRRRYKP